MRGNETQAVDGGTTRHEPSVVASRVRRAVPRDGASSTGYLRRHVEADAVDDTLVETYAGRLDPPGPGAEAAAALQLAVG